MADSGGGWATVPTKADRERERAKAKKKSADAAAASTGAGASSSGGGAAAVPTMNVTGAATPGARLLSTFQFLDDEEDIEAMRAKQKRALAADNAKKAAEEADELAAAAAAATAAGGKKKKPHHHKQQPQQKPSQQQPTQKLPAAAAALDPEAFASFVAELQSRYGGPQNEPVVLGALADFLLRHFSRVSGIERWATALHAAVASDGASLVVVGSGGGSSGNKKKAAASAASPLSPLAPATLINTPHADLPAPLANALGSFVASCGLTALGQVVDDLLSAAVDGASARPKPGQAPSAPQAGLLVLLASILRARPEALLAALPALQRRAVRPTAAGAGGSAASGGAGGGAPAVPPLLSPGALPLTLWTLAQAAAAGEPGVALAAWCRLVLPALLGEEALVSSSPSSSTSPPPDAMDARGRAAALAFGEALLTAVDGGSAEGPGGGFGAGLSFFGPGAAARRQQQQQRSRPLDARLGDGLGEVAVVPGTAVELVSRVAFPNEGDDEATSSASGPVGGGKKRARGLDKSLLSRLAALHPRLQAAAARSGLPGQFEEWLAAAVVLSGGAAAAASASSFSSPPSPLAERAATAAALCLASEASCFALWADELHAAHLPASAALLAALDESALAPVLAAPALKPRQQAGGNNNKQQPPVPLGGAPAARELFATRLPARHRGVLLGGAGGGGGGGGKAASSLASSSVGPQQQQQQYRLAAAEAEAACERLACGRALGAAALYRASGGDEARAAAQRLLFGSAGGAADGAGASKKPRRRYKSNSNNNKRRRPRRRGSFAGAALRWALLLALLAALCARHRRDDALAALSAAAGPKVAARADELFFRPLQEAVLRAELAAAPVWIPIADKAREVGSPLVEKAREALGPAIEKARPLVLSAVATVRPALHRARVRVEQMVGGRDAAAGEALAKAAAVVRAGWGALAEEARGIVERGRAAAMRDRARDQQI